MAGETCLCSLPHTNTARARSGGARSRSRCQHPLPAVCDELIHQLRHQRVQILGGALRLQRQVNLLQACFLQDKRGLGEMPQGSPLPAHQSQGRGSDPTNRAFPGSGTFRAPHTYPHIQNSGCQLPQEPPTEPCSSQAPSQTYQLTAKGPVELLLLPHWGSARAPSTQPQCSDQGPPPFCCTRATRAPLGHGGLSGVLHLWSGQEAEAELKHILPVPETTDCSFLRENGWPQSSVWVGSIPTPGPPSV